MIALWNNLFDFSTSLTRGQWLHCRLVELFVVSYAIWFSWEWGLYIPRIEAVALPLGLAQYLDITVLFGGPWPLVNAAACTLFTLLGLARRGRWSYLAAFASLHLQYVSRYCLGEISHGSNFIGMSLLGLGLALPLFAAERDRMRFALGFMFFFFGLAYTSAAFCKLIGTGLDWADGLHFWLWSAERQVDVLSKTGAFVPNPLQALALEYRWLGTLLLGFGLVAELAGVLLWSRRWRGFELVALAGMHLGIAFSLDIFFEAFFYQLVLLLPAWGGLFDRLLARFSVPALAPG